MNPVSIIINWSGPFTYDKASMMERQGIYMCFGRNKLGPAPEENKLLYCGISERDVGNRIREHGYENYNHEENDWWIGHQAFPRKKSRKILGLAEWVIIYFSEPEYNSLMAVNPPYEEVFLINEWFFEDGKRRSNNIGVMQHISDVLCWSPDVRLVREGNLTIWEH